ncbi:MAG: hypothetical protein WA063_04285 [Minisyncoccia bacterium]
MRQMLIEKTKNTAAHGKGLFECNESPDCPVCDHKLRFQKSRIFTQKVLWICDNDGCKESSFMRIKMGNIYFLIKP